MTKLEASQLIEEIVNNLLEADAINPIENFGDTSVLLGEGAVLDSISFITFITDVEDKIQEVTGKELYLVLSEIDNFNVDNPNLTADGLANYIHSIT